MLLRNPIVVATQRIVHEFLCAYGTLAADENALGRGRYAFDQGPLWRATKRALHWPSPKTKK